MQIMRKREKEREQLAPFLSRNILWCPFMVFLSLILFSFKRPAAPYSAALPILNGFVLYTNQQELTCLFTQSSEYVSKRETIYSNKVIEGRALTILGIIMDFNLKNKKTKRYKKKLKLCMCNGQSLRKSLRAD